MNKLEKFNEMLQWAKDRGYNYSCHIMVRDGNIAWTSHYPTIFHAAFLEKVAGEHWDKVGHNALTEAFNGGDAINLIYQEFLKMKGAHYAKSKENSSQESTEESTTENDL